MTRALVLDSGVGGLSIVRALRALLPQLAVTYVADTAGFPYGGKSPEQVSARIVELAARRMREEAIDVVVIACNTASTVGLPALRASLERPVVGVVPPIKTAGEVSRTRAIGLLATPLTAAGRYVDDLIARFASDCRVVRVGSPELAAIAEEKLRGQTIALARLQPILAPFFAVAPAPVDTIILGCTHYPFLLLELQALTPAAVTWLDPAPAIARRVKSLISEDTGLVCSGQQTALFTQLTEADHRLEAALAGLGLAGPVAW